MNQYRSVMVGASISLGIACGSSVHDPVSGSSGTTSAEASGGSSMGGAQSTGSSAGNGGGSRAVGGSSGSGAATANGGSVNGGSSGSSGQGGANPGTLAPVPAYWQTDWITGTSVGSVGVDASEHVYVGGVVPTGKSPGLPEDLAIFVRRYDVAGNVLWTKQWASNDLNLYGDLVVDPSGTFYLTYVAGTVPFKTYRSYLGKYDATGAPLWEQDSTFGGKLTLGPDGDLFIAGAEVNSSDWTRPLSLARYDDQGTLQWQTTYHQGLSMGYSNPVVDADGNAYVAVNGVKATTADPNANGSENLIYRFDPSGAVARTQQVATTPYEIINAIALDSNGNLYTSGVIEDVAADQSKGYDNALLRKYDATGKLLWTQRFGNPARSVELGPISVDRQGNPYVVGYSEGPVDSPTPPGAYVAFVRKYDSQGVAQWTEACSLGGGCRFAAISIAASGNVYAGGAVSHPVHGEDNEQGLVAKYLASDSR